jgi:DUF971 family protein
MSAPAPSKIRLDRNAHILEIEWPDGRTCRYPWAFLRARCHSAGERTARASSEPVNPLSVLSKVPSEEITDVRLVGSYALNFTWADGHGAGIYTWDYLQTLAEDPRVQTVTRKGENL